MNIFEQASRSKLRFETRIGPVATDQLWDLPLTSRNKTSLDDIARHLAASLRALAEDSFVDTKPDPAVAELTLKLDIVKHIIAMKIAERDAAKVKAEKAEKRERIKEIIASKQDEALAGKTIEELMAEYDALA